MRKTFDYHINFIWFFFCFFLFFFSFQSNAYPAASSYFDTVQRIYIGYYQRPADPEGLLYWANRLNASNGNLNEIIDAFANSTESQGLYGSINSGTIAAVVNNIYLALFNRNSDEGGRTYYVNSFNAGQFPDGRRCTAGTIVLDILYGAINEDLLSINNKQSAANLFTKTIDPELDGLNFQVTYAGDGDVIAGRNFLTLYATSVKVPTQGETTAYIQTNIADPSDPITSQVPGTLDVTFGKNGKVVKDIVHGRGGGWANSVGIQADGKIVAAGQSGENFAIARYNTDGSLDKGFNGTGMVTTDMGGREGVSALGIQTDGKIVVAGTTNLSNSDKFMVARYNTDGSLDASFGGTGKVKTYIASSNAVAVNALTIQADGKILVAGNSGIGGFAVVRYNTDGSLDTNFNGGIVITMTNTSYDSADATYAIATQSDGKIVVAGSINSNFAVARYNADGSLDNTFGTGGIVATDVRDDMGDSGWQVAYALGIQADGKIVVAGTNNGYSGTSDFVTLRYLNNGSLDISFGNNGKVITAMGAYQDTAYALGIQSDGKIVVAGAKDGLLPYGANVALARYNNDGSLDSTFGAGGKVVGNIGNSGYITSLAIQSDGKIVAAGNTVVVAGSYYLDFAVVRYNTNGSLDTSFGDNGRVSTDVGGSNDYMLAIAIQPDGKIVAAGTTKAYFNANKTTEYCVVRLSTDGTFDTTFGTNGIVTTDVGSLSYSNNAHALGLQPDGKIVVAGTRDYDCAIVRYNPDGSLDTSFGSGGIVITDIGGVSWKGNYEPAYALAIQSDGKIVIAGSSNRGFYTARYNTDGSLDTSFGGTGIIITDESTYSIAYALAIQPDGKIVIAGETAGDMAIVRYNTDGSLDTSFGGTGKVKTYLISGYADSAKALRIQSDGKMVIAGRGGSGGNFALIRLNPDGSLDTSFGSNGKVITDLGRHYEMAYALGIQSDGKIVVAGDGDGDFAIVRYHTTGSIDTSFGGTGIVITDMGNDSAEAAYALAIQSDGRIVVAGTSGGDMVIVRYNP